MAPLAVTADASGSTDTDATGIASYEFDFGDGTPLVRGAASASHTYCKGGSYVVTVVVTDSAGNHSSGSLSIDVTQPANPAC